MSSRTNKIGIKEQLRNYMTEIHYINRYFKQYDLNKHFLAYIKASAEKKELPKKLIVEGE